jgi:hypothetical protein
VAAVVVGILVVRRLDVWGIDALGPVVLWGCVSLLAIPLMSGWFASWRAGRNGLDQWPNPHGRYYNEWLRLPETQSGVSDYYEWLAQNMGNGQPWRTWARQHAELSFSEFRSIRANDDIRNAPFEAAARVAEAEPPAED